MRTDRLHLVDSRCFDFDATVLETGELGGRPTVVLDRSAFYAEGGGQLGDRGVLDVDGHSLTVVDTQLAESAVHHVVERLDGVAAGAKAVGRVDRDHRRGQMAEHTAQHMLSEALLRWAGADTASSRLSERSTTIDLDRAPSPDQLAECEARVNALIREDRPVHVHFPSPSELASMSLRSVPKVTEGIRVVEVDDYDWTPCGGTHCTSTAQVGLMHIVHTEAFRGGMRVRFVAGEHALDDYRTKDAVLAGLAAEFTCGATVVPAAVAKLRASMKAAQQTLGATRKELVDLVADAALAAHPAGDGPTLVFLARPHDDVAGIRALTARLGARPDVVAFVVCRGDDGWLFAARHGDGVSVDLGGILRGPLKAHGARGGGRPPAAQGKFTGDPDWKTVRDVLEAALR